MTDYVHRGGGRPDIGCLKAIEMFYAYMDKELTDPEIADFEHHLRDCRSCLTRAEFEDLITRRLRELSDGRAPQALRRRLDVLMQNF